MMRHEKHVQSRFRTVSRYGMAFALVLFLLLLYLAGFSNTERFSRTASAGSWVLRTNEEFPKPPELDRAAYDLKMMQIAHATTSDGARSIMRLLSASSSTSTPKISRLWPAKAPYPKFGALLPEHRIVAYYGNFYAKGMGVLGEYPENVMLTKLLAEVAKWNAADPSTPVVPAIDYIAIVAQGSPIDGTYRSRMPDDQIDHALALAKRVNGIVILDVQVGLSTLQQELPLLKKYLAMTEVHLAIDPEFSMKTGAKPGTVIGTFSATDVNYAANYLAALVKENDLPPKVLIVHRFTQGMVTSYRDIRPLPEVQIVMDMDGWGPPEKKIGTYTHFVVPEPVQFTGFKLFYKNDIKPPSTRMLTPEELLRLKPQPLFIQFQ